MLSVEEILADGSRRVLDACEVPADTVGPASGRPAAGGRVLVAAGVLRGRGSRPRPVVPAPRPPADDLLALALAVGVVA